MSRARPFAFGLVSLLLSNAAFAQEARYILEPFGVDPLGRAEARASSERLPRGVVGALPTEDGGFFALEVADGLYPAGSTEEIQRALDEILPAVGYEGSARELWPALEGDRRPAADLDKLSELGRERAEQRVDEIEEEVGPLTERASSMLEEATKQAYEEVARPVVVWRFDQLVGDARAEGRSVIVETDGRSIQRIVGALYGSTKTSNEVAIGAERAASLAERYAVKAEGRSSGAPELVVLADGEGLRNAWRVDVETAQGLYFLWVDAQTGEIVQVRADFASASVSAQGLATVPGIPLGFQVEDFTVDDASSCQFTLDDSAVLTLSNAGTDGVSGDVTGCKSGGIVDFDVAPQNDTSEIFDSTAADYNGLFQQVTVYAQVYGTLDWFGTLGSQALPVWTVTVNHNDPCGFGIDNACGGNGNLTMGIGGRTMGYGSWLWNTSLDQSVVVHETGHGLIRVQYAEGGGTLVGSLDEGVADYWAMSRLDSDMVGVVSTGTTTPVQDGTLPRQADVDDVFPEHLNGGSNSEVHANGQIIARALWDVRTEMEGRGLVGGIVTDELLMRALLKSGVGQTDSLADKRVHDAYQALEIAMLNESQSDLADLDILVGFAHAGIMTSDKEAVVDVSEDIQPADGTPPSFTVFTGEDYAFSGTSAIAASPYNTMYEIEVASDKDFTVNYLSSGPQSNVAVTDGVPQGTWTMTPAQWAKLEGSDKFYFRATTWTPGDASSKRTSTHWLGENVEAVQDEVIIVATGGGGCSIGTGKAGLIGGVLLSTLALRRRRLS